MKRIKARDSVSIFGEYKSFHPHLFQMAWIDLKKEYSGTVFDWIWSVLRPGLYLVVYWLTLKYGFRANNMGGDSISLFTWLAAGIIAWFYQADAILASTNSIRRYRYLITKMKYPASAIPFFVNLAHLFTHIGLALIVIIYLAFSGFADVTWVQIPFLMLTMYAALCIWGMFAAPLAAVSKDFVQIVKAVMRVMFWFSGVIWNVENINVDWLKMIIKANPITFFIESYRNALIYHRWVWEDLSSLLIFLGMMAVFTLIAIRTYKRTRKEVADAL